MWDVVADFLLYTRNRRPVRYFNLVKTSHSAAFMCVEKKINATHARSEMAGKTMRRKNRAGPISGMNVLVVRERFCTLRSRRRDYSIIVCIPCPSAGDFQTLRTIA